MLITSFQRLIGIFLTLVICLISPILLVRIGRLRNSTLGTLAQEIDYWFFFKSNLNVTKLHIDLWYLSGPITANKKLLQIIKSKEIFLPKFFLEPIFVLANKYSIFNQHLIPQYVYRIENLRPKVLDLDLFDWDALHSSPGLKTLIPDFENLKSSLCDQLKIHSEKLAGIHIRDSYYHSNRARILEESGYLRQFDKLVKVENLQKYRDSNFTKFLDSIDVLDNLGYFTIRFGLSHERQFDKKLQNYLDLNLTKVELEADLILICRLSFLICSTSGVTSLARFARTPQFLIDFGDVTGGYLKSATLKSTPIVLPKVFKSKTTSKNLSFYEIQKLSIYKMTSLQFRHYYNSPECPFYLCENDENAIKQSILTGEAFLNCKTSVIDLKYNQKNFHAIYPFRNSTFSPMLSPYWPNLS